MLKGLEPIKVDHTFYPDAPYVILWRKYKDKDERKNNWIKEFRGKRMVVVDGGDKGKYWEPFISFCTDSPHIYVKENSYTDIGHPNVRVGCYAPSDDVINIIKKDGPFRPTWGKKKIDVFFRGDLHYGRDKKIKKVKNELGKYGVNYEIGKSKYDRKTYLKKMASSKVTLCFQGKGTRTRREWEALLCGSVPWYDNGVKRPFMYPSIFEFNTDLLVMCVKSNGTKSGIPKFGFHTVYEWFMTNCINANILWTRGLRLDLRIYAMYLFGGESQIMTPEQLNSIEDKHGLWK